MACDDTDFVDPKNVPPFVLEQKDTVTRLELAQGTVTNTHRHDSEIMVIVVSGAWRFYLPNRAVTVGQDQALRIPAGMEHRTEALADTIAFNVSVAPRDGNCCGAFVPQNKAELKVIAEPQYDPDQYLWGV